MGLSPKSDAFVLKPELILKNCCLQIYSCSKWNSYAA